MMDPGSDLRRTGMRWAPATKRAVLLLCLGLVAWVVLWSITSPRAGYDTLWYELFGLRYAGATEQQQVAESWAVFAAYADPDVVARHTDAWPWQGHDDPSRQRWVGLYQMRPVFPILVAATHPLAGEAATLTPSVMAVVIFTLAVGLAAWTLLGPAGSAVLLLLSFANPLFAGWLIHLTTDGLGLALWAAMLLFAARWIQDGTRGWLVALLMVSLVAAFNRQTGVVLTLSLGFLTVVALGARQDVWRRLAAATFATAVPITLFSVYGMVAGLPTFADMLQDTPTRHFLNPEHPNLPRYVLAKVVEQAPVLLDRLLAEPHLWIPSVLGMLGLALARTWWAWLFLTSLVFLPVLHFVHPILTEANRTLAPAWFNVHVGLVLLASIAVARFARPSRLLPSPSSTQPSG